MRQIVGVIPSYNSRRWLDDCLRALTDQQGVDLSVVVVDNASSDGSGDHVRRAWPEVRVLLLDENVGYGEAVNIGARLVPDGDVLALNPDIVLAPNCLRSLAHALERDARVGVAAPMLLDPDGRLQPSAHRFPTPVRLLAEALLLDRVPGIRRLVDYHNRKYRYEGSEVIGWATGAVLLIRRKAFTAVSGFDPSYFLYVEEIDLQRRIADHGYTVVLEPRARAVHHGGKQQPIAPERFLLAHDGFERLLAPNGGMRAAAVRLSLCLTALTRGTAWLFIAASVPGRRSEARRWASMFFRVTAGSLRKLPSAMRTHRSRTSRGCYVCGATENPVIACEQPVEQRFERPIMPEGVYRLARCRRCSTLYVDSDVSDAYLSRIYRDETPEMARHAAGIEHADLVAARLPEFEDHWRRLKAHRPPHSGDSLLDVGCQTGEFGSLVQRDGVVPNGIDLSVAYAEIASARWGPDSHVHAGALDTAPFDDHGFNYVAAFETLEHVCDPIRMITRMRSWLANDGVLAISVPSSDYFHFKYWLLASSALGRPLRHALVKHSVFYERNVLPHTHIYNFSHRSLRLMLEQAGFQIRELRVTGWHGRGRTVMSSIARAVELLSRGRIGLAPSLFAIAVPRKEPQASTAARASSTIRRRVA